MKKRAGQGMVEYILIVALVAIVVIAAIKVFGKKVSKSYKDTAQTIESEVSSANKSAE